MNDIAEEKAKNVAPIEMILAEEFDDINIVKIILSFFYFNLRLTHVNTNTTYDLVFDDKQNFIDLYFECINAICDHNEHLNIENLQNALNRKGSKVLVPSAENVPGIQFYTRKSLLVCFMSVLIFVFFLTMGIFSKLFRDHFCHEKCVLENKLIQ